MRRLRVAACWCILAIGAIVAGCDDRETKGIAGPSANALRIGPDGMASGEWISSNLAVALAERDVQRALLKAMRKSPYTFHRVLLSDLLSGPAGQRIVNILAKNADDTPERVRKALSTAGRLEVFLPFTADRKHWNGTGEIAVVSWLRGEAAPQRAFSSQGRIVDGAIRKHKDVSDPVVLLVRPSGILSLRYMPQADVDGPVVQDPNDGEAGGYIISYGWKSRDTTVVQLADYWNKNGYMRAESPKKEGAVRDIGSPGPDTTFLGAIYTADASDGIGGDWLELRWNMAYVLQNTGQTGASSTVGLDIPVTWFYLNANVPLLARIGG